MHVEIVTTSDGLHSLYVPALGEHYHSTHGALQEARHVFIEAGFSYAGTSFDRLNILEVGFGTGLNFYLTLLEAKKISKSFHYTGIELYPVPQEIIRALNYTSVIGELADQKEFENIHQLSWDTDHQLYPGLVLQKKHASLMEFTSEASYNLVYFDAFGFRAQEEMWSQEVFSRIYDSLVKGGVMVTYASKGEVRRRLAAAGFEVSKLPGPAGKREMVRAIKH